MQNVLAPFPGRSPLPAPWRILGRWITLHRVPFGADLSESDLSVSLRAIYQSNRFNFSSTTWGRTYAYSLTDTVVICEHVLTLIVLCLLHGKWGDFADVSRDIYGQGRIRLIMILVSLMGYEELVINYKAVLKRNISNVS